MKLDIVALMSSRFMAASSGEEFKAAFRLWCTAWHQIPAGTLPDDDRFLCQCSGYGLDLVAWAKIRPMALHGFRLASDGLLHHAVLEEKAQSAADGRRGRSEHGAAGAAGKWGTALAEVNKAKRRKRVLVARSKGTHTLAEWAALVTVCGTACLQCGATGVPLVKDHIKPLYQGGSDALDNLQPLCRSCNASKGPDDTDLRPNNWFELVLQHVNRGEKGLPEACPRPAMERESKIREEVPPKAPRRRGVGLTAEQAALFEVFWVSWPVKQGKEPGKIAFAQALNRGAVFEDILVGVKRYAALLQRPGAPKPKYPQGWLNDSRWQDEMPAGENVVSIRPVAPLRGG